MAYTTGTASDHVDFYNKLVLFLTSFPALVTAGQNWTSLSNSTAGLTGIDASDLLRGPGSSGTDQIHIRLSRQSSPGTDTYGMNIQYFDSYNSTLNHSLQPGISTLAGMALWNNAMSYWFIANGRRFIAIAKVSTVYTGAYCGFFLPYSTPSEFPYPIMVLGTHEDALTHRWSQGDHNVGGFWDPSSGNAFARDGSSQQLTVANYGNGTGGSRDASQRSGSHLWPYDTDLEVRENVNGTQSLLPIIFHTNYGGGNVYGELEGVFFTSAFGLGSEDTVTINSKTYLIVQSVYRTTRRSYAALLLE